jgi:hypothetical protein
VLFSRARKNKNNEFFEGGTMHQQPRRSSGAYELSNHQAWAENPAFGRPSFTAGQSRRPSFTAGQSTRAGSIAAPPGAPRYVAPRSSLNAPRSSFTAGSSLGPSSLKRTVTSI